MRRPRAPVGRSTPEAQGAHVYSILFPLSVRRVVPRLVSPQSPGRWLPRPPLLARRFIRAGVYQGAGRGGEERKLFSDEEEALATTVGIYWWCEE